MCELIEEYANKRAELVAKEAEKATREAVIRTTIEELSEMGVTKEKIAQRLKVKYNLNKTQIAAYMK